VFKFLRIWLAFLRRDYLNLASYRLAFVMGFAPLVFYLLIFFFVDKVFSGLGSSYLARYGGDYFPFVVVGLALQSVVGAGLGGFAQVIAGEQHLGTLEPMLCGRVGPMRILVAASLSRYLTAGARLAAYIVIGSLIFGAAFRFGRLPLFVLAVVLTAGAYTGLGMVSAAFLLVFKRGNPVGLVFGQLAVVLSGVFFPVEVLPAWLRYAAAAIPLTHGLTLARAALLEDATAGGSWLALAALAAGALAAGVVAFRWAFARARRDGSLGQY
jgi:ABC-2 type transport system permease protein